MNDVTKPPGKAISESKEKEIATLKAQLIGEQSAKVALSQENQSLLADNGKLRAKNSELQGQVIWLIVFAAVLTYASFKAGRAFR